MYDYEQRIDFNVDGCKDRRGCGGDLDLDPPRASVLSPHGTSSMYLRSGPPVTVGW